MKKHSKILVIVAAIVTCLVMAVSLSACGGKKAAIKNVYTASKNINVNTVPAPTFGSLTVTVYADGTYMLCDEVYQTNVSSEEGTTELKVGSEFGQFGVIAYGTYTETKEEDEITLKLSKPTSLVFSGSIYGGAMGVFYYNTEDKTTFEVKEGEEALVTAENLLNAVTEYSLTVDARVNRITAGATAGSIANGVFAGMNG